MTNLPWRITKRAIGAAAHAGQVCLINDFHAAALSLPHLQTHDIVQIGGQPVRDQATKVVLGAGTGLGVAALAWMGNKWVALPSEGGHMAFAAQTVEEFDIVAQLRRDIGYVSCESMLSGPGLARLYRLLQERPGTPVSARDIVHRADVDGDPTALQAVRLFVAWLGRFAGDVALVYGARGGVYIAGGIAPKILGFLFEGHFRAAFEAKGQSSNYLGNIPVYLIKTPQAGLIGAALALADTPEGRENEVNAPPFGA